MTTCKQRIEDIYADLVDLSADIAAMPGTETARMAAGVMAVVQALVDVRAVVICNQFDDTPLPRTIRL